MVEESVWSNFKGNRRGRPIGSKNVNCPSRGPMGPRANMMTDFCLEKSVLSNDMQLDQVNLTICW